MIPWLIQGTVPTGAPAPSPSPSTVSFTPDTTTRFVNPEAGPYAWVGSPTYLNNFTSGGLSGLRTQSIPATIVMALLDLSAYVGTATIPSSFITAINNQFQLLRSAGLKCIVRPVYNYTSGGTDATLSIIQAHMSSLSSLWASNVDVIWQFQMGWLGDYGEFHDGSTGGASVAATKLSVMNSFMSSTPTEIPIAARYPADMATWFPTAITASAIGTGTNQSRLAVFNDGYLAGASDSGTYDNRPGANSFSLAQLQAYAQAVGVCLPTTGEVTTFAGTPLRTPDSDATYGGSTYGWGALNFSSGSGPAFFTAWNSTGIIYTIANYYGYRIQLDSMSYPSSTVARGTNASIAVNLRNTGYARMSRQRALTVTLANGSTTCTGFAGDMRGLPGNATSSSTLTATVAVPGGVPTGTYQIYLSAPDNHVSIASDVRYSVQFANANSGSQVWNAGTAQFNTGASVTVV